MSEDPGNRDGVDGVSRTVPDHNLFHFLGDSQVSISPDGGDLVVVGLEGRGGESAAEHEERIGKQKSKEGAPFSLSIDGDDDGLTGFFVAGSQNLRSTIGIPWGAGSAGSGAEVLRFRGLSCLVLSGLVASEQDSPRASSSFSESITSSEFVRSLLCFSC